MQHMGDLAQQVRHYVEQLSTEGRGDAWQSLREMGPSALPFVLHAFHTATDLAVRVSLIEVVSEYRAEEAVPFLAGCLQDSDGSVWKRALDGLVTAGGQRALQALADARHTVPDERQGWIDEAIRHLAEGPGGPA